MRNRFMKKARTRQEVSPKRSRRRGLAEEVSPKRSRRRGLAEEVSPSSISKCKKILCICIVACTVCWLLNKLREVNEGVTKCFQWDDNTADSWWTEHPQWEIKSESEHEFCFEAISIPEKGGLYQRLHDTGFHGVCSDVASTYMWSSGWSADFGNVINGLMFGLRNNRTFQIWTELRGANGTLGWHYASTKHNETAGAVCPSRDMFCFFLNISSCDANQSSSIQGGLQGKDALYQIPQGFENDHRRWMMDYVNRPQRWLRKEIFDYHESLMEQIETPCVVMHVRRTDVVLHGASSRKYHAIHEYLDALNAQNVTVPPNILLLTDDENAIEEAHENFPSKNWMHLTRPRHRGVDGGWENQTPSNDPKQEVVVILSTFRAMQQCSMFVHGHSGFSSILATYMKANSTVINIDAGKRDVKGVNNSMTKDISKRFPARNPYSRILVF